MLVHVKGTPGSIHWVMVVNVINTTILPHWAAATVLGWSWDYYRLMLIHWHFIDLIMHIMSHSSNNFISNYNWKCDNLVTIELRRKQIDSFECTTIIIITWILTHGSTFCLQLLYGWTFHTALFVGPNAKKSTSFDCERWIAWIGVLICVIPFHQHACVNHQSIWVTDYL